MLILRVLVSRLGAMARRPLEGADGLNHQVVWGWSGYATGGAGAIGCTPLALGEVARQSSPGELDRVRQDDVAGDDRSAATVGVRAEEIALPRVSLIQ